MLSLPITYITTYNTGNTMGKTLNKEDIDRHNSYHHRYINDARTNKHYANINVSRDDPLRHIEDSPYGDTLTIGGNPELVWELADKHHDMAERGFSPEEYDGMRVVGPAFPVIPLGKGRPIPNAGGASIFDNGVVLTASGKIASITARDARQHYGATSLTRDGEEKKAQFFVQLWVGGKKHVFRIAHLQLLAHDQPQPSSDHVVWFKNGNFADCTIGNLRWVKKESIKTLSKA